MYSSAKFGFGGRNSGDNGGHPNLDYYVDMEQKDYGSNGEDDRRTFGERVRDGDYIFGDGEGFFHNLGELAGKTYGWLGKQAYNAISGYGNGFFSTELGEDIKSAANQVYQAGKPLLSGVMPVLNEPSGSGSAGAGGAGGAGSPGSAEALVYGNYAPGAQLFGMDRETAYQEYMANTAHQREVADLRAAGLNPVLGISGSGASVVSGNAAGASSAQKGLDSGALVDVIGATAGLLTTIFTKNPSYGYMVKNAVSAGGDFVISAKK